MQFRIADANANSRLARALLDTQCRGHWISKCLVAWLGKEKKIFQDYAPPSLQDVNGHDVVSCGIIPVEWWWSPDRKWMFDCEFFVFADSDQFDVLFGVEYFVTNGLLGIPKDVMAHLIEYTRLSIGKYLILYLLTYGQILNLQSSKRKPPLLCVRKLSDNERRLSKWRDWWVPEYSKEVDKAVRRSSTWRMGFRSRDLSEKNSKTLNSRASQRVTDSFFREIITSFGRTGRESWCFGGETEKGRST